MVNKNKGKWTFIIIFLLVLSVISFITAGILNLFFAADTMAYDGQGNVAVIQIKGPIYVDAESSFTSSKSASSSKLIPLIEEASKNENIEAIIFDINSPGGSPVGSDEIAQAIKKTNKTTVALIRELGTSGAYWIASATNHIIANKMSITGSIGVIGSYLEFGGLLNDYNVSYERLVSGKYKDIGSPFRELTTEERKLYQDFIDGVHVFFIEEVAENRNMTYDEVEKIATGMFYLGVEALDMNLVDELGSKQEAIDYLEKELGHNVELTTLEIKRSLFSPFFSAMAKQSYFIGTGIGDSIKVKETSLVRT